MVENNYKFKKSCYNFQVQEIFFQIMFEGIKIFSTLECVRGFIPKCWTNI